VYQNTHQLLTYHISCTKFQNYSALFAAEIHKDNQQHRLILEREHKAIIRSCVLVVEGGKGVNGG
jgi:hypothetical protein